MMPPNKAIAIKPALPEALSLDWTNRYHRSRFFKVAPWITVNALELKRNLLMNWTAVNPLSGVNAILGH